MSNQAILQSFLNTQNFELHNVETEKARPKCCKKITSKKHHRQSIIILGSVVSTASISFENRDMVLPVGVVSKKCIGTLNTLDKSFKCNINAAFNNPKAGAISVPSTKTPKEIWFELLFDISANEYVSVGQNRSKGIPFLYQG